MSSTKFNSMESILVYPSGGWNTWRIVKSESPLSVKFDESKLAQSLSLGVAYLSICRKSSQVYPRHDQPLLRDNVVSYSILKESGLVDPSGG